MRSLRNLAILAGKQALRHRTRSVLTVLGVAVGLFLFSTIETLQAALREATEASEEDNTLVVYRENRFCPSTSRLPESYLDGIRAIPGVADAIPVQIAVNHCGASLDVIAFRGVPGDDLRRYNPDLTVVSGSYQAWRERPDAALVGTHFAARRGLEPGDFFAAVGLRVFVAGIVTSPHPQDENVAYVHLPFLQESTTLGVGTVTQFNVRVDDPEELDAVAARIDGRFGDGSAPTVTRPEKAFFAQTARDMVEMIAFTRWLGLGAVVGVIGLLANALLLAARSRRRECALLQTIGFPRRAIALLVLGEGLYLGMAGGALGILGSFAFLAWRRFTFGNEGLTLAFQPDPSVALAGMGVAMVLALVASLWPALEAARGSLVRSLREG